MAFDKKAWDPTPAQFAAFAIPISWIAAYLVEKLLLAETDVAVCLRKILAGLTGGGPLHLVWTPIILGVVVPFLFLWGLMMFDRKNMKYKRIVLGVGILVFTATLVLADLKIQLF